MYTTPLHLLWGDVITFITIFRPQVSSFMNDYYLCDVRTTVPRIWKTMNFIDVTNCNHTAYVCINSIIQVCLELGK